MTIEHSMPAVDAGERHDEIAQFVYRATGATGLLAHARALLDAAPKELAESFEQAVRSAGLAS